MSNEEKMRKDFAAYWDRDDTDEEYIFAAVFGTGAKRRAAMAFYAAAKACAAIKDAEIAKLQKHNQDLRANALANEQANYDQVAKLVNEIAARDLMIKELREALTVISDENMTHTAFLYLSLEHAYERIAKEALAKSEHYNSRALEKKLLEARIDELKIIDYEYVVKTTASIRLQDLQEKLAELNKE